jgi:hypothetical protein
MGFTDTYLPKINKYSAYFFGFLLIIMYVVILINGESNVIHIYDNLDSEITARTVPLANGNLFSISNDEIIPQMINGLKRNCLNASATKFETVLFYFFPPIYAYLLNYVLVMFVAFVGMYLLFSNYILNKLPDQNKLIAAVLAFTFVTLPFFTIYGMAVLGAPMLAFCVLNLLNGRQKTLSWIYIIIYPFNSSLVLGGYVVVGILFIAGLWYFYKKKKEIAIKLIGISILIGSLFIIAEINLFNQFFFDKSFVSHRTDWDPTFDQMIQGAEPLGFWGALERSLMVLFIGEMNDKAFPRWIILFFLFVMAFRFRSMVNDKYIKLIVASMILISLLYGYYFSAIYPWVWLKNHFMILKTFRIDRFFFFLPFLWYILFAFLIGIAIKSKKKWMIIVTYIFLSINLFYTSWNGKLKTSAAIFLGSKVPSMITWERYFAEGLFDKIKQDIDQPLDSFRTVNLGFDPAITLYNGFYTLDIYSNNYPLEYKKQFREIIAPELEKSPKWKASFDKWGGNCFIVSSELVYEYGPPFMPNAKSLHKLEINTKALYNMGGRYMFSAIEIENHKDINMKFLKKYTDKHTPLTIYLYKVLQ